MGRWSRQDAANLPDLIVFDGDCVLCSWWARFVDRHDRGGRFAFVAIQSPAGQALAGRFGVNSAAPETNIVILGGMAFFKSDAALALFGALPGWRWIGTLRVLPKPLRDWLYDRIARNRYRWFGRREACVAPNAGLRARFIERIDDLA